MNSHYPINTETGEVFPDHKKEYLREMHAYKSQGLEAVFVQVKKRIPDATRLKSFFFVQVEYITAQNMDTIEYSKDTFEAVRKTLQGEFLLSSKDIAVKQVGDLLVAEYPSLKDARKDDMYNFVEAVHLWGDKQGYFMPNSEYYFQVYEDLKAKTSHNIAILEARKFFKELLSRKLVSMVE